MGRRRIDKLVVERGMVSSREKARRLILAGEVLVDEVPVDKPGALVDEDADMRLRQPLKTFVGRGGEKLAGALDALGLDVRGLHVLDVGRGQLDWKLYSDPRVHAVESINVRYLKPDDLPERFPLITVDVSFISLTKVLPALVGVLDASGLILMLVKPQFELSPGEIESGGLVRDPNKHEKAIESVKSSVSKLGLSVVRVVPSPVKGATGNQEFFLLAKR